MATQSTDKHSRPSISDRLVKTAGHNIFHQKTADAKLVKLLFTAVRWQYIAMVTTVSIITNVTPVPYA